MLERVKLFHASGTCITVEGSSSEYVKVTDLKVLGKSRDFLVVFWCLFGGLGIWTLLWGCWGLLRNILWGESTGVSSRAESR